MNEKEEYIKTLQARASLIGVAIELPENYTDEDLMNAGYELEHQEMNVFLREKVLIPDNGYDEVYDECEDEHVYDPTRLTLKIKGSVMLDTGLSMLCYSQEFDGESLHMELKDYDVVISVIKRYV